MPASIATHLRWLTRELLETSNQFEPSKRRELEPPYHLVDKLESVVRDSIAKTCKHDERKLENTTVQPKAPIQKSKTRDLTKDQAVLNAILELHRRKGIFSHNTPQKNPPQRDDFSPEMKFKAPDMEVKKGRFRKGTNLSPILQVTHDEKSL